MKREKTKHALSLHAIPLHAIAIFISLILLLPSCRQKQGIQIIEQTNVITCGQSYSEPNRYKTNIAIHFESDSSQAELYPPGKTSFWLTNDSLQQQQPLELFMQKNLRYPKILKESEVQGRWFYLLEWNLQQLQNWKPLRFPAQGEIFNKEMDRVLKMVQRDMRFYSSDSASWVMKVDLVLEKY